MLVIVDCVMLNGTITSDWVPMVLDHIAPLNQIWCRGRQVRGAVVAKPRQETTRPEPRT